MHAEICYAECLLQKAALTFVQVMNVRLQISIAGKPDSTRRGSMVHSMSVLQFFCLGVMMKGICYFDRLWLEKTSVSFFLLKCTKRLFWISVSWEPLPFKETVLERPHLISGCFSVWDLWDYPSLHLLMVEGGGWWKEVSSSLAIPFLHQMLLQSSGVHALRTNFSCILQILFFPSFYPHFPLLL